MTILAGIDEAGYGPLLGPLMVTCVSVTVPDEHAETDLWRLLSDGVARVATKARGRAVVADSKLVHKAPLGIGPLEENVFPFLMLDADAAAPATLREMLQRLGVNGQLAWDAYPWYGGCDVPLPCAAESRAVESRSRRLRAALTDAQAAVTCIRTECLEVGDFNREVAACGTKSQPLAARVTRLMRHAWDAAGDQELRMVVDKQGGRDHYADMLSAMFPESSLDIRLESAERSEYELTRGGRRMRVRFEPRADQHHLPTALASMVSKYCREVMLRLLNDFWRSRVPGLQPTAGYYSDGRRFLNEIEPARAAAGISLDCLLRCR